MKWYGLVTDYHIVMNFECSVSCGTIASYGCQTAVQGSSWTTWGWHWTPALYIIGFLFWVVTEDHFSIIWTSLISNNFLLLSYHVPDIPCGWGDLEGKISFKDRKNYHNIKYFPSINVKENHPSNALKDIFMAPKQRDWIYMRFMQAVNQLCSHFEAYSDIPKITELREKFKGIKEMLKSHVFSDFARLRSNLNIGLCVFWETNLQIMEILTYSL